MKRRGLSFMDAVKQLGVDPGPMPERDHQHRRAWQPAPAKAAPGAAWQAKAMAFMLSCQKQLELTSEAMAWLQAERGLNPETISQARLGWNPQDKYESRESWGLAPEVNSKGKIKMVWLPRGLVIPLADDAGQAVRIRTRRSEPGEGARYVVVSGSDMQAMTLWTDQPAVAVVERFGPGVFDSSDGLPVCLGHDASLCICENRTSHFMVANGFINVDNKVNIR